MSNYRCVLGPCRLAGDSDWLSATDTKNLKTIFLVHGESKALESLKGKLQGAGFPSVELVRANQHYALV